LVNILSIVRGEAINILYIAGRGGGVGVEGVLIIARARRDAHFAGASVEPNQYLQSSLQLVGAAQGVQRRGIPMVWSGGGRLTRRRTVRRKPSVCSVFTTKLPHLFPPPPIFSILRGKLWQPIFQYIVNS